jgi:hypothetical protein
MERAVICSGRRSIPYHARGVSLHFHATLLYIGAGPIWVGIMVNKRRRCGIMSVLSYDGWAQPSGVRQNVPDTHDHGSQRVRGSSSAGDDSTGRDACAMLGNAYTSLSD